MVQHTGGECHVDYDRAPTVRRVTVFLQTLWHVDIEPPHSRSGSTPMSKQSSEAAVKTRISPKATSHAEDECSKF